MVQQQPTVADIFRRAQALRQDHSDWSYKQIGEALVKEFSGAAFPPLYNLTIPEQDARAPEEDWTAGLPIVRRGIQFQDWNEVVAGIILSLEQTENYERDRGPEGSRDDWHDRNVGIDEAVAKGVGKWMPEELLALAERKERSRFIHSYTMSFLNNLFQDPNYQTTDPRKPEEIDDPEIIISPDTRRENRMPPGQSRTKKWPVLDAHGTPEINLATWSFEVDGLVEHPQKWSLDEFMQLEAVRVYADFHCVTRWSRLDNVWSGVSTREVARRAGVKPEAKFVLALAYDYGWTTNVPIEYFLKEDSLFAWAHDGQPIPPEHGGPVRLIIPQLYAWKSAKWVKGVRFLEHDQAGFWEEGGYHMRGVPWGPSDGERFRWS